MELTVIIISFNARDYLKQCLSSVIIASENIDCEIFVVDNNSSDDSCIMVENEFPQVILIKNKFNKGFSAANNQAIKISKGRYILLLNPDTLVNSDTFAKGIRFMDDHPDAGAMGVKMINGEGVYLPESKRAIPTPLTTFFKTFGFSCLFPKSALFNRYYLINIKDYETSETEIISGAFMLICSKALIKRGLLDEQYFMYGEDIDMSYRLLQAGFKNYYNPDIRITHFKGKSTERNNYNDIFHFYRAMRIYVRKRSAEGNFSFFHNILIIAIYFREGLALINRFFHIIFRN